MPGTRSSSAFARDTWLVWTHIYISSFSQSRPVPSFPHHHHHHLLLSFDAALVSPWLSPSCLYPFPNISRASVASCDWCACDYSSWQPHSSMRRNPKYLEKTDGVLRSVRSARRVATRSGRTRLWQWHPPSNLSEPASGGWRPTFGSPLFSPPLLLPRWLPHFPTSSSSSSSFSSSSSSFFDFFCLASGPLELYLISFCWVN